MPYLADRVSMSTATTGTGDITLGSATAGYQSFATAFGSGSTRVGYAIADGNNWEVGKGVFNGTTGLTRESIRSSSSGGAAISLSGSATVWCDASAELLDNANVGQQVAGRQGLMYSPFG
jgi:hypothetical protein